MNFPIYVICHANQPMCICREPKIRVLETLLLQLHAKTATWHYWCKHPGILGSHPTWIYTVWGCMGFPVIVARASLWRDQQVALLWGPRFGFNLWIVMHLWLKPPPLPALVSNLVRGHKLKSKKMIQRLLKRLSYVHIYISIYVLWFQAVVKGPGTTGKQHKSIT